MSTRNSFRTVVFALVAAASLSSSLAGAQTVVLPEEGAKAAPAVHQQKVHVGLYLMNLGRVDIGSGTYPMDFYLVFRCDEPCDPSNVEVMNGKVTIEKQDDTPLYHVLRVRGELAASLDLRPYPFDRHELSIALEDKALDETQLVYVADDEKTGTHRSVTSPGWDADNEWKGTVTSEPYPIWDQTYSRLTFTTHVSRPPLAGLLKGFLPALFIVLTGMLAVLMGPDKIPQRLTVSTSALIGSVLFHINLTGSIPPVNYLTFADRFMLLNYVALVIVLSANVLLMWQLENNRIAGASRVHRWSMFLVPAIYVLMQGANALAL